MKIREQRQPQHRTEIIFYEPLSKTAWALWNSAPSISLLRGSHLFQLSSAKRFSLESGLGFSTGWKDHRPFAGWNRMLWAEQPEEQRMSVRWAMAHVRQEDLLNDSVDNSEAWGSVATSIPHCPQQSSWHAMQGSWPGKVHLAQGVAHFSWLKTISEAWWHCTS